ncbi:MAG: vWA domain-containing protein [Phycisphaerales bacterium]
MVTATLAAIAALLLVAGAEALHARRTARVAKLAFGPTGAPRRWARAAPVLRTVAFALATWGAVVLYQFDPVETEVRPDPRASRQLLVVLDVSPSMNLADAGPGAEKVSRMSWAGKLLRGILDRLDMKDTRVSMIAFYTRAIPMLQDSTDKELLANFFDGLPLYTAFKPGETDLQAGLDAAYAMAKGWARRSTTLVVITDGDLNRPVHPGPRPLSIADAIVIGVGDPSRPTVVSGHSSRQDEWALRGLASALGGVYHQGNTRHLPREVVESLAMVSPRVSETLSLREAGLVAVGLGCGILGLLGPALLVLGVPRAYAAALQGPRTSGGRAETQGTRSTALGAGRTPA